MSWQSTLFWHKIKFPFLIALFVTILVIIVTVMTANISEPLVNKLAGHSTVSIKKFGLFWNNFGYIWDGAYFVNIAQNSYSNINPVAVVKNEVFAFFPLFPLEIKFFSSLFNLEAINSILIASWINIVLFCICLYKLFTKYIQTFDIKNISSKLLLVVSLVLPFNFFYFVPYTESLFVFLLCGIMIVLLNFYSYKPCGNTKLNNFWINYLLPILCFLISLTRSPGIVVSLLLFIALVGINIAPLFSLLLINSKIPKLHPNSSMEEKQYKIDKLKFFSLLRNYLQGVGKLLLNLKSNLKLFWKINLILISSIITNILGLILFLFYGYTQTGNFWISRDIQANWYRGFNPNIYETVTNQTNQLFLFGRLEKTQDYYNVLAIFLTIVCTVVVIKYFPKNWFNFGILLLSLVFALLPLSTGILFSYSRLFIICPVYFLLLPIFITKYITYKPVFYTLIAIMCGFNIYLLGLFSIYSWIG